MTVSVCDSHRKSAPSSTTALNIGYFKLIVWIVMLGPFAFAFLSIGRGLFLRGKEPPKELGGFGCFAFVLIPMLIGQITYLIGFPITGRVIEWLSVFLMICAAIGIATAPFMPGAKVSKAA